MADVKYLAFPLTMLAGIFDDRYNVIVKMMDYGICHYAKQIETDRKTAVGMCYYDFINKRLPPKIGKLFQSVDVDPQLIFGAADGRFDPTPLSDCDIDFSNPFFKEYANIRKSLKFLNLPYIHIEHLWTLLQSLKDKPREPTPMVNRDVLIAYRDYEKSEFEIMQLCLYASIKATIGKKRFVKTNIQFLLGRALPDILTNEKARSLFSKYSTRRRFGQLMAAMCTNWGITKYSNYTRGMYLSNTLDLDQLANIAEKSKRSNQVEEYKAKEKAAKIKAMEGIKLNRHN